MRQRRRAKIEVVIFFEHVASRVMASARVTESGQTCLAWLSDEIALGLPDG
jgi:hypothetical protein